MANILPVSDLKNYNASFYRNQLLSETMVKPVFRVSHHNFLEVAF